MPSLFRPEATNYQRRRLWGDIVVIQPVSYTVITILILAATGALLFFSYKVDFVHTETIRGFIALPAGGYNLYPPEGGVISDILIQEGDIVGKNKPMFRLSKPSNSSPSPSDLPGEREIVAPLAGQVAMVRVERGMAVTPTTPLALIADKASANEALLLAPPNVAGRLSPGQKVQLRLDMTNPVQSSTLAGHVIGLSGAPFRPGELAAPIDFREPVFRVVVAFDRTGAGAVPAPPSWTTLSAEIVTDRRNLVDMVFSRGGETR